MTSATGTVAVVLALLAAVPWTIAFAGPDGLVAALALAPPVLMGIGVGLRRLGVAWAKRGRWDSNPVPRC